MACHYSLESLDSPSKEEEVEQKCIFSYIKKEPEVMRTKTEHLPKTIFLSRVCFFYSHWNSLISRGSDLLCQFIFHLALSSKGKQYGISIVVSNNMGKWTYILKTVVT